jgi:MFS family permease
MIITQFFITSSLLGILFIGNNWVMLYILIGILAVFYGVTFPLYGACAGDYYSREVMGTVIGAWTPLYGTGAILSHWAGGILRDATGNYNYAFTINAVMAGIALILFSRVKKESNNPL